MTDKRKSYGRASGRKAVELRKARLAAEPLCRMCRAKGRTRAATVPDHIRPLAQGGTDTADNIQCLCADCHRDKTARDFGHRVRPTFSVDGWPVEGA